MGYSLYVVDFFFGVASDGDGDEEDGDDDVVSVGVWTQTDEDAVVGRGTGVWGYWCGGGDCEEGEDGQGKSQEGEVGVKRTGFTKRRGEGWGVSGIVHVQGIRH